MNPKPLPIDSRLNGSNKDIFWERGEIFDSSLSPYAILVRLYLASCAIRKTSPSLKDIAKCCGITETEAEKAIAELLRSGWLRMGEHPDEYILCSPLER